MGNDIFVIADYFNKNLSDITFEMLGKGKELKSIMNNTFYSILLGSEVEELANKMGIADEVIYIKDENLKYFIPEAYVKVISALIKEIQPKIVLIGQTSNGLDTGGLLSSYLNIPFITSCSDIEPKNGKLIATQKICNGKLVVETEINAPTAIVAILPGSFKKEKGETTAAAKVKIRNSPVPLDSLKTKFCSVIEPPKGDVDITQQAVLVSVGRGIQNKENIQVAEELAKLLNGVVSASRPVVDQGWLPLTRLVGRSGMLVKPKLYFALGISGAPEHVEGMKNSSTIIAVNTDPKAPIFSIADYGVVCDLFDVANALIEKLRKNL